MNYANRKLQKKVPWRNLRQLPRKMQRPRKPHLRSVLPRRYIFSCSHLSQQSAYNIWYQLQTEEDESGEDFSKALDEVSDEEDEPEVEKEKPKKKALTKSAAAKEQPVPKKAPKAVSIVMHLVSPSH